MTEQQKQAMYGPVIAQITSSSNPSKSYLVRIGGTFQDYSCQCMGFRFNRTCKHIEWCKKEGIGADNDDLTSIINKAFLEVDTIYGVPQIVASWWVQNRIKLATAVRNKLKNSKKFQLAIGQGDSKQQQLPVGVYQETSIRLITLED